MRANDNLNWVECLSWDQVAARISNGAAAILPVGAGAKQHGFHLPMNTDRIQAEALASKIAQRIDTLIWPSVNYGHYPAFAQYAGSCSLSAASFEAMIQEIVTALVGYGCAAVFVLDTGISTIASISRALERVASSKTVHLRIHDGPRYRIAVERVAEQSYGSHADELETSLMLALAPGVVEMWRAEPSPTSARDAPGALTSSDTASLGYSRSGSFGDPTLATCAKGEILLSAMVDDLVEQASAFFAGRPVAFRHGENTV